jgi:PST family polysaccharide transporter
MMLGRLVTQASRLIVSILLARLLSPETFGLIAVAMTTILALEVIKDLGTGAAVIQRPSVDQRLLSSTFYLNVAAGVVAGGLMALGAPLIAGLFDTPAATPVVRALSLVLVLGGLSQTHHAVMRRKMRFSSVAAVEMTGALVNGGLSIVLALGGAEVWSMVYGAIAGSAAGTVVAWFTSGWKPSSMLSIVSLRSIAGFSLHTAAYNATTFVLQNTDKLLVGRWLGTAPLGIYSLAQRTISYPMESIAQVLMAVLFPALSRVQDDNEALRRGYFRATGAIAFVTLPLMFGTAVVAGPLVETVFGQKWAALVPLLWFMAPAGALGGMLSVVNTLYSAKGRADQLFRWGLASGLFTIGMFALGLQWGLKGLAVTYLLVMVVLTPVGFAFVLRLIDTRLSAMLRSLAPYFLMTAAMSAAAGAATYGSAAAVASSMVQLAAGVSAGGVVYIGLAVWIRPPAFEDLRTILGAKRGAQD